MLKWNIFFLSFKRGFKIIYTYWILSVDWKVFGSLSLFSYNVNQIHKYTLTHNFCRYDVTFDVLIYMQINMYMKKPKETYECCYCRCGQEHLSNVWVFVCSIVCFVYVLLSDTIFLSFLFQLKCLSIVICHSDCCETYLHQFEFLVIL